MSNIYQKFLKMSAVIEDPVLATVTGAEGSTPQKPGSSAIFGKKGLITGTVGGGVVEGRTQEFALECGRTKKSGYLHYELDRSVKDPEEAICGGRITILVDGNPFDHLPLFSEIEKAMDERKPGVLLTEVSEKDHSGLNINRYWITGTEKPDIPPSAIEKIDPLISEILSSSDPDNYIKFEMEIPGEKSLRTFFLEPLFPLPKLIIAGAGHIGKALSHLGRIIGFEVTVIDNRREYANPDNLPDADHIIVNDIGRALEEADKASDTYIVIVTRGHSDDAAALKSCIGSEARYVGMIGSRPKVAKMHSDFVKNGWATEDQWSSIFTPIGLEIKSKTVEEIAVSIAAQLVLVRNSKKYPEKIASPRLRGDSQ